MKRNVLFDLGHPGHFHLFKGTIQYLRSHPDYNVFITTRNIPIIIQLLESAGFAYTILGTKRNGQLGKLWSVIETDLAMLLFVLKNKIKLGLHCGIVLSHVSKLTSMRSWIFDDDDDEVEPLMVKFSHPFSEFVFTPDCIQRKTKNAIYYPGTHELSYLYNKKRRDDSVEQKYAIIRLVAFNGHHDTGHQGLNEENLNRLVTTLERFGSVYITSEKPLPERWNKFRIAISPERMHDFMSNAIAIVGDSQTMISEAASMGVSAFKCNSFAGVLSVPNMLEKEFQLCYSFLPEQYEEMEKALINALSDERLKADSKFNLARFKSQKLNTSGLITHLILQWNIDHHLIRKYSKEDWLSLSANFVSCQEILP